MPRATNIHANRGFRSHKKVINNGLLFYTLFLKIHINHFSVFPQLEIYALHVLYQMNAYTFGKLLAVTIVRKFSLKTRLYAANSSNKTFSGAPETLEKM